MDQRINTDKKNKNHINKKGKVYVSRRNRKGQIGTISRPYDQWCNIKCCLITNAYIGKKLLKYKTFT